MSAPVLIDALACCLRYRGQCGMIILVRFAWASAVFATSNEVGTMLHRRSACVSKIAIFLGFERSADPFWKFEVPIEFQGLAPPVVTAPSLRNFPDEFSSWQATNLS